MGNSKSEIKGTRIILSIGFLSAAGAICFFIFKIPDFWPQMLAIIASAFLGAGATAWITNTLLNNKQKAEEAKERNIKVYENKIQVYSEFISKMWKTLEDDIITDEEIFEIRFDIFNKLIFYLKKEDIEKLCKKVENIKNSCDNDGDDSKRTKKTIDCFSEITNLLRADVNGEGHTESTQHISELWNKFGLAPRDTQLLLKTQIETGIKPLEPIEPNKTGSISYNFWHFIMFDNEQIDEAFKNNKYELSLIEYGETWRTNRVKQVKQGDIVFLFCRGGYGYIGVFIVKGWRVFYFEENREEIQKFDNDKPKEVKGELYEKDIEQYDIYYSKNDGATLCANIIVEPIAFDYKGVNYPGSVYRHTISQYPDHYAKILLSRFLKNKEENKPSYNKLSKNIEMAGVKTNEFKKIIDNLKIQPAEKDENGNWKEDNK